ncbi:MAG: hypothetical protein SPJ42_08520 [Oscillospiraceae bacterium]|nr:hypothetical protein [Clostridiaceae bacterium]MDO4495679.1 hypothetical protein [Clostridiaceae bacterium]MDY5949263.1 hypothetical protein [Oscillospiraceae bacterium]
MSCCISCQKELRRDDIGFHKKMVNRGAEEFMCIDCLCAYFGLSREKADEMIKNFKETGCTLFE